MKKLLFISLALGLLWGCAKQGYPSGGPKDNTPPVAGVAVPPSGSTGFAAQEFFIPFDEYVTIKDAENNVLVSPPMKKKPEYVSKGKGVLVRIKDTLREGTTYLFQFKGAVADINEGNVLESYEYAFSTGSVIDSMTHRGVVLDALTLKPREEAVSVMLYESGADDSAAAKEPPVYITRCDKQGRFAFNCLKPGSYRILAIEDENKDMRFTAGEAVAFSDTLVVSRKAGVADTATADSAATEGAIIRRGSARMPIQTDCRLLISTLKQEKQRVTKSDFLSKGRLQLVMQSPLGDYELKPLGGTAADLVCSLNPKRDTLNVWTRNGDCDSIVLVMHADGLQDTLKIRMKNRGKSKAALGPVGNLPLAKTRAENKVHFFDSLRLEFINPMRPTQDSIITIRNMKDSSVVRARILLDEAGLKGVAEFAVAAGCRYEVRIEPGMMADIYGHRNDTVKFSAEISSPEQYGRLILAVDADKGDYLIELLDEKMEVVSRQTMKGTGVATFEHLSAGKYMVRAIADLNGNGEWDAGDYWTHRQPEHVVYLGKTLDVRENWDIEEAFSLKE
ncbi:MAG: Ig-like domain-containing protein [Bacteroidales bacterium]|nr:Ig-like domain-containing protein [Bacteroidales bacterium]